MVWKKLTFHFCTSNDVHSPQFHFCESRIHDGFQGNPLYDLAVQLGEPLSPEEDYTSAYIATLDGSPSNQSERIDLYISFLDNVMDRITALKSNPATNSSSMDVPLSQIYEDFVQKMNLTAKQQEATNLMAHTGFQVLLNANISKLSTLRYGDAKTLPAIDVLLKNGFDSLTDILKQGLDIKYNTPVVSIAQDTTGATVTDANGTTYRAKYVVTTQSLGCLKADMIKFDPPLPVEKLKAINEMGMGVLDKVILVYDREQVFWSPADFISREMPDLSGDWSVYLNNNRTLDMPVLVALNAADTAKIIENQTNEDILTDVVKTLKSMYPNATIPAQPREYYVTRWAQDPWARGSYSYFAVGNDKNITEVLAEPFGRLLFAGEATSSKPATVLGAYLSGIREGERLSELLKAKV